MIKKVLLVATLQSHIAQFHQPLIELLKQHKIEVHVAARDNLREKNGLAIKNVDEIHDVPFSRSPLTISNLKAFKILRRLIDIHRFDIVHCNTPVGSVITRLICLKYRRNGLKVFYTAHGFHFYKGAPYLNWIIYFPIEKILSKITDKIIVINREDYYASKLKLNVQKVYRINGVGVDHNKFCIEKNNKTAKIRQQLSISKRTPLGICIGELLRNKNQEQLIRAVSLFKNNKLQIKILICGNGKYEDYLVSLSSRLGVSQYFEFLGYRTDIADIIQECDFGCSMSIREGLGLNIIEECLCGKPVLCTRNRGHSELVSYINGYLVDIGDIESTAYYLLKLSSEKDRLQFNPEKIRNSVMNYSKSAVLNQLAEIYDLSKT